MNNRILFIFLLIIGLLSCKNSDDGTLTYFGKLDSSNDTMKLYTKNGLITDSTLLKDFVRRHNGSYQLFNMFPNYTATILNLNSVALTQQSGYFPPYHDTLNISEINGVTYWESRYKSDETMVMSNIFMYWPLHATKTDNGDSTIVSNYYYCYYLKRDGNDFILPIVSYFFINDGNVIQGSEKNEFDPNCIVRFGNKDTIIIHSYNLRFKAE